MHSGTGQIKPDFSCLLITVASYWHKWPVFTPIMIVNDDSSVINKLETSLIDDARVVIYDHNMFIVQAIGSILEMFLHLQFTNVGIKI